MSNVMITGATSFIGKHLIDALIQKGDHIVAVVRPNSKNLYRLPKHDRVKVFEIDIENISTIINITNRQFSQFYHLAWEGTRGSQRDDAMVQRKNYKAAIEAIRTAHKLGCTTFIGTGSQAEYGNINGEVDESHHTNPITEYGKSKLRVYNDGKEIADAYGMRFIWTRIFSAYGEYDYDGTLIMSCIKKMLKNEEISLTECIQMWDFVNVKDVAAALIALGETTCDSGIYHIASGTSKPLKEFVLELKRIINSQSDLKFGEIPYGAGGIVSFAPHVRKLMNGTGWYPKVSFKEGIKSIIENIKRKG